MGAFNTLIANLECDNCHRSFTGNIQFKVGERWQYYYRIGDEIRITSEDNDIRRQTIAAYGILEEKKCPHCGNSNFEEYDIDINCSRIEGVNKLSDLLLYLENNEGRYFVKK